ncbi:MAG: sodium transport system permease protein [Myxococcota bacterium]
MSRLFWTLLGLELRLQLRSRVLWLLLVLPLVGGTSLGVFGVDITTADLDVDVGTSDAARVQYPVAVPERFAALLDAHPRLEVVERSPHGFDAIPDGSVAAVGAAEGGWTVRGRGDNGRRAAGVLETVLEREARNAWRASWEQGAPVDPTALVQFDVKAVPPPPGPLPESALLAFLVSGFLGLTAYGAATQAYTTSRQRKTRHTLGLVPAAPLDVHLAKLLVVAGLASLNGALATTAWLITRTVIDGALPIGPVGLVLAALATVCLALQLASAWCIVTAWAPDRRTVSFIGSLVLLAMLMIALPVFLPSAPLLLGLVPIAGATLGIRLAAEATQPAYGLLTLVTTGAVVWSGLRGAATQWEREHGELRRTGARQAAGLYTLTLLLVWFLGQAASALHPLGGLLFLQIGIVATCAVAGVAWVGRPLGATLSLRAPHPMHLLGGVLLGLGTPLISLAIHWVQAPFVPTAYLEALAEQLISDRPVWANLLLIALLPAVCEELLFRGALLGLLRDGLSTRWAVLLTAVAFAFLHLDVPRLGSTFVLGVVLGLLTVRTGSLWPAIAAHAANNATAVLWSTLDELTAAWLGAAGVAGLAGVWLVWRRR